MTSRWATGPTYEMASNPPAPATWNTYSASTVRAWNELLASDSTPEHVVQAFLERHPAVVPGCRTTAGAGLSGHYPEPPGLITQPPLRGLNARIPDFMWIATNSSTVSPILVEIERPNL